MSLMVQMMHNVMVHAIVVQVVQMVYTAMQGSLLHIRSMTIIMDTIP